MHEAEETSIAKIAPGGDGIGRLASGKLVFVPLSAAGDRLSVRITGEGPDFARAEIDAILEPGPGRRDAPCPLYGTCGGCNLMHLDSETQRAARLSILSDAFSRSGGFTASGISAVPDIGLHSGDEFRYRSRMQFCLDQRGKPALKRRGTSGRIVTSGKGKATDVARVGTGTGDRVAIAACPVASRELGDWLTDVAFGKIEGTSNVPQDRFTVFASPSGVFVEGLSGDDALARVGGRDFRFPVASFFQSNLEVLELLVSRIVEEFPGGTLLDLYGGSGTLSAFLAGNAESLTLVESDLGAIARAKANLANAAGPVELKGMPVEDWVRLPHKPFDTLVCDPPRGGLCKSLRELLKAERPKRVFYVSCDPVTLARDCGELARSGYRLRSLELFDFYPQTAHVESLAILERQGR